MTQHIQHRRSRAIGLGFALAGVVLFLGAQAAEAELLNLQVTDRNTVSTDIQVNWAPQPDKGGSKGPNGTFTAKGTLSDMTLDGGQSSEFVLGNFSLTATIEKNTGTLLSASLLIEDQHGGYSVLAQSSTVLDWGHGVEDKFEFVFLQEATNSVLSEAGQAVGIILDGREIAAFNDPNGPFFGSTAWSNNGAGVADGFGIIPEPTTAMLAGLPALALLLRRRKRPAVRIVC